MIPGMNIVKNLQKINWLFWLMCSFLPIIMPRHFLCVEIFTLEFVWQVQYFLWKQINEYWKIVDPLNDIKAQ